MLAITSPLQPDPEKSNSQAASDGRIRPVVFYHAREARLDISLWIENRDYKADFRRNSRAS
jgi:hypothetical protein